MLGKLKEFLKGEQKEISVDKHGKPTPYELLMASAVLMIEMAGADKDIAHAEAQAVCDALASRFGIDEDEIPELVQAAIAARQEKGRIDEFVKAINENFNDAQRQQILSMVWRIVLADGKVDKFEERFAKQLMNRLRLSSEQAEEAREMAQAEVGND
ncbi:MAG: TerB family tellurite resistance protein [Bdellovibrionales bacterium]|nr:TerB family tellurite resistance protein [Bdellovibrionales bacterium]